MDSSMNIVYRQLETISPYEKNPRKNDDAVEYVANSIREFGFKVPIVIDKDGVIVAGHTRYKAAKKLNMDKVPCIVADDLTDEQIKAFRLADNKTAEKATWDFDLLAEELDSLFEFDMEAFGFDEHENEYPPEDLDNEEQIGESFVITIRFDDIKSYSNCKNQIEPIVENYGGRLSVNMK